MKTFRQYLIEELLSESAFKRKVNDGIIQIDELQFAIVDNEPTLMSVILKRSSGIVEKLEDNDLSDHIDVSDIDTKNNERFVRDVLDRWINHYDDDSDVITDWFDRDEKRVIDALNAGRSAVITLYSLPEPKFIAEKTKGGYHVTIKWGDYNNSNYGEDKTATFETVTEMKNAVVKYINDLPAVRLGLVKYKPNIDKLVDDMAKTIERGKKFESASIARYRVIGQYQHTS